MGGNPDSTIPPLFPCWLAVLMQAAGPELPLWLPGLFHAAFRATAVVLVYLLGHRYFGRPGRLSGSRALSSRSVGGVLGRLRDERTARRVPTS